MEIINFSVFVIMVLGLCVLARNLMKWRSESEARLHHLESRFKFFFKRANRAEITSPRQEAANADVPALATGRESQIFAPKSSAPPHPIPRPSISEILAEQDRAGAGFAPGSCPVDGHFHAIEERDQCSCITCYQIFWSK